MYYFLHELSVKTINGTTMKKKNNIIVTKLFIQIHLFS